MARENASLIPSAWKQTEIYLHIATGNPGLNSQPINSTYKQQILNDTKLQFRLFKDVYHGCIVSRLTKGQGICPLHIRVSTTFLIYALIVCNS